ncbi:MAG: hypothetical protein AAGI03_15495 [Pseudomonadota bacterium]
MLFAGTVLQALNAGHAPFAGEGNRASVLHFNTLLQFDTAPEATGIDVGRDPLLAAIEASGRPLHVFLCYAPEPVLMARIQARQLIEPDLRGDTDRIYPRARVLSGLEKESQRGLLLRFADRLERAAREIEVVFSTDTHRAHLTLPEFRRGLPTQTLQQKLRPEG